MDNDKIQILKGLVVECNNGQFKVQINENYTVLCSLSGTFRRDGRLRLYDRVRIEVSESDTNRGFILNRISGN